MRIGVGNLVARCRRCGGQDFDALVPGDSSAQAVFACSDCRTPTTRLLLLMSVSAETVKRSARTRAKAKRLRNGGRREKK